MASKEKWVRKFVIAETGRHSKGYTIYKVTSVTFQKGSPNVISKVSMWKRYRDFKKLHNDLSSLCFTLQIKEPLPSFPKPKFFRRFEAEVIEDRRQCALKLIEYISRHSSLLTSDVFVKFFDMNKADKQVVDCEQSMTSETSEDEKSSKSSDDINDESRTTNLPKFVCTQKLKPTKVSSFSYSKKKHSKLHDKANIVIKETQEQFPAQNNNIDKVDIGESTKSPVVLHDGSDLPQTMGDVTQYILIAAAHMSAAFRHEAIAEYEESFTQYKLGISHLLNGVQSDPDMERRATIRDKIQKYLQRAERLYNRHLNCNISVLSKPVTELGNYKVVGLINRLGSVMLVQDTLQGFTRLIKTVEKTAGCKEDTSNYILRGKVPYMVQLYACTQTDTTVFLILQYVSRGKLWDYVKSRYKPSDKKLGFLKRGHTRSFSCDAVIQGTTAEKKEDTSVPCIRVNDVETTVGTDGIEVEVRDLESPHKNLPTTQLVEKAQKLLHSVDATLKRSNSIASRLNVSERLMYKQNDLALRDEQNASIKSVVSGDADSVSEWGSLLENESMTYTADESSAAGSPSKLSLNGSCTDLNLSHDEPNADTSTCDEVSESWNATAEDSNNSCPVDQLTIRTRVEGEILEVERESWKIPEHTVQLWAAQILSALEALHQQDIVVSDLRPDNILIDDNGHACMTYIVRRKGTELKRLKKPYTSPELCMFTPPIAATTAADVWSFGVLLYELLTGFEFQTRHPGQFLSHSMIYIPDNLSRNAKSLLSSILKFRPNERSTIPDIKRHPFFAKVDWLELLNV